MQHLKMLAGLCACVAVIFSAAARAQGIPVVDAGAIAKFIEQIQTAKAQLDMAKLQMESMTGGRGLGMIMNDPSIRASLPTNVRSLLGQLDGDLSGLGASTNSILAQVRAPVGNDVTVETAHLRDRSEELDARLQALNQQGAENLNRRAAQIDALQQQIDATQDPKAIAELQARIQIEQSNIAVEQQRLDAGRQEIESEKTLLKHRAQRVYSGWFSAPLRPNGATSDASDTQ
ncbi:type IV secretion system protein [Castellaniella sp. UC4442_H9]